MTDTPVALGSLDYGVSEGIATLTINNPDHKNAFTLDMVDAWAKALHTAEQDEEVRVVILTGTDNAFCSGVALGELDSIEPTPLARKNMLTQRVHKVPRAVEALSKPMIAAVNGVAVGAGLDMALMCDMRFAARSARLSEGYIKVGLVPGDGGAWLLPRLVGPAKAMELLMTGCFVSAEEARRIGMVNRVYDDAELSAETTKFARQLCGLSPLALSVIKRSVGQSATMDLRTALDAISSHMAVIQSTDDYTEAQAARREKRAPEFHAR